MEFQETVERAGWADRLSPEVLKVIEDLCGELDDQLAGDVVDVEPDKVERFKALQYMRIGVNNVKNFAVFKAEDGARAKLELKGEAPAKKGPLVQ